MNKRGNLNCDKSKGRYKEVLTLALLVEIISPIWVIVSPLRKRISLLISVTIPKIIILGIVTKQRIWLPSRQPRKWSFMYLTTSDITLYQYLSDIKVYTLSLRIYYRLWRCHNTLTFKKTSLKRNFGFDYL